MLTLIVSCDNAPSDSWRRVFEGSEQRHVITPDSCTIVEDGFLLCRYPVDMRRQTNATEP